MGKKKKSRDDGADGAGGGADEELAGIIESMASGDLKCLLCSTVLPAGKKAVKQHLKSRSHKDNASGGGAQQAADSGSEAFRKGNGSDSDSDEEDGECAYCAALGRSQTSRLHVYPILKGCKTVEEFTEKYLEARDAAERSVPPESRVNSDGSDIRGWEGGRIRPCMPPPLVSHPRGYHWMPNNEKKTFLTVDNGVLDQGVPKDLPQCLEMYFHENEYDKLPNVDVAHLNEEVKSFPHGRRLLGDAFFAKKHFWSTFVVDEHVQHPTFWPESQHVPTYTGMVIASGNSHIGLHTDGYGKGKDRVEVETYLTFVAGYKHCLIVPPLYKDPILSQSVGAGCWPLSDPGPPEAFPIQPSAELLWQMHGHGGHYFDLEAHPEAAPVPGASAPGVTMLVPKGWPHWLIGGSEWTVLYGGSRFIPTPTSM